MRGIVTQASKDYAVLLNESGEFIKIKNKNYCIGQTIDCKKNVTMLVSIAASFLIFIFIGMSGYGLYYSPDNYISIDINPSIQLTTNRFSKVIDMQSFNYEGSLILERGAVKHKSIENAIEDIIALSTEMGYLSEHNNQVEIEVVKNDKATMQVINQKLEKFYDDSIVINIGQANAQMLELSRELEISVGRTKAIYEYTKTYGGDLKENKERFADQSVGLIKKDEKSITKSIQTEKSETAQSKINEAETDKSVPVNQKRINEVESKNENSNQGTEKAGQNQSKSNESKDKNADKPVEKPKAEKPRELDGVIEDHLRSKKPKVDSSSNFENRKGR